MEQKRLRTTGFDLACTNQAPLTSLAKKDHAFEIPMQSFRLLIKRIFWGVCTNMNTLCTIYDRI